MTEQAYQKARQLMADAYKAGYEGKPIDSLESDHAALKTQYLRGKIEAERQQKAKPWEVSNG